MLRDPFRFTGGEEGRAVAFDRLPDALVGVFNTRNVYRVALAFAVVVCVLARFLVSSRTGHVWQAIRVNAIAPLARPRMTEGLMLEELLARLDPTWVSPLVGWLVSDACTDTGHVYSVAGGYYSRVAVVEGTGIAFDHAPSVDELADARDRLVDLGEWVEPGSLADQMERVAQRAAGG